MTKEIDAIPLDRLTPEQRAKRAEGYHKDVLKRTNVDWKSINKKVMAKALEKQKTTNEDTDKNRQLVSITSQNPNLNGKRGRVFYKHPDGKADVQVLDAGKTYTVALKAGEYHSVDEGAESRSEYSANLELVDDKKPKKTSDGKTVPVSVLARLAKEKRPQLKKEEVVSEGLRHIETYSNGNKMAKVYKDGQFSEHIVKFFTDGSHHKDADYHGDEDAEDAHSTAKHWCGIKEEFKPLLPKQKFLQTKIDDINSKPKKYQAGTVAAEVNKKAHDYTQTKPTHHEDNFHTDHEEDLKVFRQSRSNSPAGDLVRKSLGMSEAVDPGNTRVVNKKVISSKVKDASQKAIQLAKKKIKVNLQPELGK